ncbi:hypothetical protein EDB84DRAFT_1447420 [Lactarius hengduanensis]|nr:hypothetical protein EDB84DRAFT_1447420 [Lactarius hengduanensis]
MIETTDLAMATATEAAAAGTLQRLKGSLADPDPPPCRSTFGQNRRHFLLDRNGKMLDHVRCPQSDHDHDHPTTTTATQLQVVCTANRKHADDNNRNDAAPNKHTDDDVNDDERGSTTGDNCTNNDCNSKTVTTSRGTLPTHWSLAGSPHAATLLDFLSSSSREPAQLRSKAIYTLSGLLKYHTAALALFEATGSGSTDSEADAGPCVHPHLHVALVADPGSVDSTSELSATTSTIMLVTTSAGP